MYKNSFTLFEVIVSLVIFSVVLISLIRLDHKEDQLQTYHTLQTLENHYIETNIVNSTGTIKLKN